MNRRLVKIDPDPSSRIAAQSDLKPKELVGHSNIAFNRILPVYLV